MRAGARLEWPLMVISPAIQHVSGPECPMRMLPALRRSRSRSTMESQAVSLSAALRMVSSRVGSVEWGDSTLMSAARQAAIDASCVNRKSA